MTRMLLTYTGPLRECGFVGPATGTQYVARAGEVFEVEPDDMSGLMRKFGTVLAIQEAPRLRKPAPVKAASEDGNDGPVEHEDADQS